MKERGFTLLELLIALSIVAALLAVLLGGLRVGLAAWRHGDERAEAHQRLRSVAELLARSVAGAFPFRMAPPAGGSPVVQFQGEERRLAFVTLAPPFPLASSIAFTAVAIAHQVGERPGLAVREKALPNTDPFGVETPLLVDPSITELTFRYLRAGGAWETQWDGGLEGALPQAVLIRLIIQSNGRTEQFPPLTVTLRARPQ